MWVIILLSIMEIDAANFEKLYQELRNHKVTLPFDKF